MYFLCNLKVYELTYAFYAIIIYNMFIQKIKLFKLRNYKYFQIINIQILNYDKELYYK